MMQVEPLLELRGLTTIYPTRRGLVRAVDAVDLAVKPGEILGLVGESGCGKSTVLLSILRLVRSPGYVAAGEVRFRGENLVGRSARSLRALRGRDIAMIFQDPLSTLNPVFSVGEQIREALRLHRLIQGRPLPWPFDLRLRNREKRRVLEAMDEVGLPNPMDRYAAYPHQFSGGMQQRALFAIALVCGPALILADEPTTALDVTIQAQVLDLMSRINRERGTAIILVTHDLGVAAEFCHTVAVMYAGRIVERGPVDRVVANPEHPYTQGLLASRPRLSDRERIQPIPGEVPDLVDLPSGCAFAPRCARRQDECEQGPVPLMEVKPGHTSRCLRHVDYRREADWRWTEIVRLDRVAAT